MSSYAAEKSCKAAGKRLCTHDEWTRAPGKKTQFPYGPDYGTGMPTCFAGHPAGILHGNASIGHLDPRLHAVHDAEGQMLERTGDNAACASRWGDDAVYDMVGNLGEWVDEGFRRRFLCAIVTIGLRVDHHRSPRRYFDYSLTTAAVRTVVDDATKPDGSHRTTLALLTPAASTRQLPRGTICAV